MINIAILLTCFNRKETTLRCLSSLSNLTRKFDVFLVDDGSTDGTSDAVTSSFPEVNIIKSTGDLFWNRGMHLAWEVASNRKDYNFYIWMNDDVILYDGWLEEMLSCSSLVGDKAIITGLIEAHDRSAILYGGSNSEKILRVPNGELQKVFKLNGNVVLIPKYVYDKLGNLDLTYHHDLGDVDYGFRAQRKGIGVFTSRIAIASGDKNGICRVRFWNSSLKKRFKRLYSPLGSPPLINFYYRRKNFGLGNAYKYFLFLHFINLLPDVIIKKLYGEKYMDH